MKECIQSETNEERVQKLLQMVEESEEKNRHLVDQLQKALKTRPKLSPEALEKCRAAGEKGGASGVLGKESGVLGKESGVLGGVLGGWNSYSFLTSSSETLMN